MKINPVFIAFFSISISCKASDGVMNCVRSSAGECIIYDIGADELKLCDEGKVRLYATFGNRYLLKELSHSKLEVILPVRNFVMAAGSEWFGYDLHNRLRLRYNVAKRLSAHCELGAGLLYTSIHNEGMQGRNATLSERLFFLLQTERTDIYLEGEELFDIGWKDLQGKRVTAPLDITAGSRIHFSEAVSCAIEGTWDEEAKYGGRFGVSYTTGKFQLRCGAAGPPITPTFGCGFVGERFRLDATAQWDRNIGYSLTCGVGIRLGEKEKNPTRDKQ